VLYTTAGSRRDAVAIDAATGETLWMYRLDEGARGTVVARTQNRGLAFWSDGKGADRILMISPGYQLVALDAHTGQALAGFGTNGLVDLTKGLDRAEASALRPSFRSGLELALLPLNHREFIAKRAGRKAGGGAEAPAPQG
jgi:glucose dehydrogenase